MLLILLWAKSTSYNAALSPQVAYVGGFVPALFYLLFYVEKWSVDLSNTTIYFLLFGAVWFVVTSTVFSFIFSRYSVKRRKRFFSIVEPETQDGNAIFLDVWKLLFIDFVGIIAIVLLLLEIRNRYGGSNLSQMLFRFRESYSSGYVDISSIVSILRMTVIASGYISIYILVNNWSNKIKSKRDIFLVINVIECVICELLFGARGDLITNLIAGFIIYVFVTKGVYSFKVNYKILLLGMVVLMSFWQGFQLLGKLLGRIDEYNNMDYIAIYLSGSIKNFDIYIRNGNINQLAGIRQSRTIFHLVNYWYVKYGNPSNYYSVRGIFQYVNGYNLGNCYTTYFAYLYDGGVKALIFYETLMAAICQFIFHKAIKSSSRNRNVVDINVIVYALLYFNILFSFFSSTFYYNCFEIGFFRTVIILYLLYFFYFKVKLKI